MHMAPREGSRRPPAGDRDLVRLLRDARLSHDQPMDPDLPARVLARLGLCPPGPLASPPLPPARLATSASTRGRAERAGPAGRGRRGALLVGLAALLALLWLPQGARTTARLAHAPGLVEPARRPRNPAPSAPIPLPPPAHPVDAERAR